MLDIMFELPDQPAGSRYLVTDDIVCGRQQLVPLPAEAEDEDGVKGSLIADF